MGEKIINNKHSSKRTTENSSTTRFFSPLFFVIFQTLNRRDDVESTGVGLAIVKKIVEDCGGKVWVESDLGKGADFKFFWPKNKKNADPVLIAATIVV